HVVRDVGLYGRLLRQARPYWLHIAALFALGLLASPIALLNPVPLRIVVDSVLGSRPLPPFLRVLLPAALDWTWPLAVAIGLLAVVQETLGALRVVKAFGQEAHETGRFLHRSREGVAARIRLALLEGGYGLLIGLVTTLGVAAVLLVGVHHVRAGALTLGELLMVLG